MRDAGFSHYVKSSHSKHKKYYLVTNFKAVKAYNEYRDSQLVK